MTLDQRITILKALELEKRMTAQQLARIAYPHAQNPLTIYKYGSDAKTYQYPPGYQQTLRILRDLASSKDRRGKRKKPELKRHPSPYKEYPDLWMLPDTDRLKFDLYQHEIMCADIFTAYWGKFTHWGVPRSDTLERLQLKPDRYLRFGEAEFFLEADRGSEGASILRRKIEAYRQYSQVLKRPFNVVFIVQDYSKDFEVKFIKDQGERETKRLEKQKKRGEVIKDLIQEARLGEMCLFTCVDWMTNHPEDTILASPLGAVYSFQDIEKSYQQPVQTK